MEKFKYFRLWALFLFLSYSLVGCTKDNVQVTVNNPEFTIYLPSNPTTGFLWTVSDYDKSLFEFVNNQYISSKIGIPGAGGNTLFTFKLIKLTNYPSNAVIKFKHSRSWEPDTATYKAVTVHIN
ncbi:MAG: hypothetical protein A3E88_04090 [Legionellales bacterium RIFCSPHIGHO2_12_FULL_35_11]|nr:MAG: hypothetical protein A3E88_04090 [Legionellales bacterium RIFCSPHIGHO2_12_FULL_35_11]